MRNTILITMLAIVTGSLLIASKSYEQETPTRTSVMIAEWERAREYTRDYLNASSEEMISFKPTPEMRSFATQMLHLADDNFGFVALASGKKPPSEFGELEKAADRYKTKEALTKAVMESYDFAIASLKDLNDAKLNETIKLFRWQATRETAYNKAFEHQTHHRGQTTVYLRLKGIKPPEERLF